MSKIKKILAVIAGGVLISAWSVFGQIELDKYEARFLTQDDVANGVIIKGTNIT